MRAASVILAALAACLAPAAHRSVAADLQPVPFVGCASDGQMGPQPAPRRASATPSVPRAYAGRLAYYQSQEIGVLAPRGWRCFGLYGSNGSSIIVTPERHSRELVDGRPIIKGPAVELYATSSETSGRFEVARVASRFFPAAKAFVQAVAAEGLEDVSPTPLTKADRITARTAKRVDFVTAAGQQGLGTQSRLAPSPEPVRGAYVIDDEGLHTVRARLTPADADLALIIIGEVAKRARPGVPTPP